MKQRYFMDTEFIENGYSIDLISIGIVSEDGRTFYACSTEAELSRAHPWVRENVLVHLPPYSDPAWMSRQEIKRRLVTDFIKGGDPQFWAYYADYDWVAFCQLFGTMLDLPTHYPQYCMDLKQWSVMLGSPKHPEKTGPVHDALADAGWNLRLFRFLQAEEKRLDKAAHKS